MSSNPFRIAGALGLEKETEPATDEVLTQGVGMPLRPISGVLPAIAPPIDSEIIAKGQPVQWMGNWEEGKYYPAGAFVNDGLFSAVANKLTLEKAAPIPDPDDPATFGLGWTSPGPPPTVQNNTSVVYSGQTYTFSQDGWIKQLRVWVSELTTNTNYRIIAVDITNPATPRSYVFEEPILIADNWATASYLNAIVKAGTVLRIYLDALNSGANTSIVGGWRYAGPTQTGAPPLQGWTQDNQRTSFRMDKTDLDGTDRSTELEGVVPDSIISVVETAAVGNTVNYRVSTVTDNTTYMTYSVILQSETGTIAAGAVCSLDINVPIPLPTEYVEETGVWGTPPSWASSVEGFLEFNGVDQGVPVTNAYGVDIEFEPASISEDWDLVSYSG